MIRLGLYKIAENVKTLDLQESFLPPYSFSLLLRVKLSIVIDFVQCTGNLTTRSPFNNMSETDIAPCCYKLDWDWIWNGIRARYAEKKCVQLNSKKDSFLNLKMQKNWKGSEGNIIERGRVRHLCQHFKILWNHEEDTLICWDMKEKECKFSSS